MFPCAWSRAGACCSAIGGAAVEHAAWVTKHGKISIFHLFGNENADF